MSTWLATFLSGSVYFRAVRLLRTPLMLDMEGSAGVGMAATREAAGEEWVWVPAEFPPSSGTPSVWRGGRNEVRDRPIPRVACPAWPATPTTRSRADRAKRCIPSLGGPVPPPPSLAILSPTLCILAVEGRGEGGSPLRGGMTEAEDTAEDAALRPSSLLSSHVDMEPAVSLSRQSFASVLNLCPNGSNAQAVGTTRGLKIFPFKDPPPPRLEKNRPGMKLRKTHESF